MDNNKLQAVLSNPELMAKIAALVKGETSPPPESAQPAVPTYAPASVSETPFSGLSPSADRGIALLYALRPFLKEERRRKLDAATGALSVASVFRGTKKL